MAKDKGLSDRLAEVKIARKEAKIIRMKQKAEKQRLKNLERESVIRNREKKGGAGVQIIFHDILPPAAKNSGGKKK